MAHKREEARREKQRVTYDGRKLNNKLKRRYHNLKRAGKHKSAAEIKTQMDRCILSIQHNHTKSKNAKKCKVTKTMRHHEHVLNVIALCVAQWAAQSGYLMVLGDLTRISHNWQKGGKFGRSMRRRLHSAMMRKASNLIYDKSRFLGVEALHMRPHNTSKICAACRAPLTGDYHKKDCAHCRIIGVDRDVNAVENIRRTSAPYPDMVVRFRPVWPKSVVVCTQY